MSHRAGGRDWAWGSQDSGPWASSESLADASQNHLPVRARKPGCGPANSCLSRTLTPKPRSLPPGSRVPPRQSRGAGPSAGAL